MSIFRDIIFLLNRLFFIFSSIYNKIEAKELVQFYKILRRKYRELSVGIITPYQKQAKIIHKLIAER